MTSTVVAKTTRPVTEIMQALFPCSSITGAPKASTMRIISELESTPRKIYTGAIGFIAPNRRAQFNVAIRTALLDKRNRNAEYGVGGGVVWASTASDEYEECLTKARVLTDVWPQFSLFETMLCEDRKTFLLNEHLTRLKHSAEYFSYKFDEREARTKLDRLTANLTRTTRVKLILAANGSITIEAQPFNPPRVDTPTHVRFAVEPIDLHNLFLYHKTTHREVYVKALASVPGCDDVILWNHRGEVTESSIANVVVEIQNDLYTPPVECGLLGGVFREHLLSEGKIREKVITKNELMTAQHVFLVNSLRLWREAKIT
jgi:para-aminobenzoate synthetase / 4-amino-4-deoxychorismate lyase